MSWSTILIPAASFGAVSIVIYVLAGWINRREQRVRERLEGLSQSSPSAPGRLKTRGAAPSIAEYIRKSLPEAGARLLPDNETERARVHQRFLHAGVYSAAAPAIYMTVKLSLAVLGLFVFLPLGMLGTIEIKTALWGGAVAGGLGMVLPSLWLSRMKARRQRIVRNSLPDFLDLVVTCLEGGLSFEGALQRVTDELQTAHPELAGEMRVVQREIELGKTPEEAIRNFAARADLEVLRSLSTLVEQARRFGSSMANSLRIHADSLRFQREQRAEENAQKATVKILIPTFLFIFPPVLIVLAGPAAMEIHDKFAQPKPAAQAPNK